MHLPATKIVCTLGPATSARSAIADLIRRGMSVARLNFSHGTHEGHARLIKVVREEARRQGRHVALLQDLQGPKIRLGRFEGGTAILRRGDEFTLTTEAVTGNEAVGPVDHPGLPGDVRAGDTVLLADGAVRLTALSVARRRVRCRVTQGGAVADRKGVNLPEREVSLPSVTRKDREDLAFGLSRGVDYVALSFVRDAEDVASLSRAIRARGKEVPVIAKLEKRQAVAGLPRILSVADAVMVARGDLAVETSLEEVPGLQRRIISAAVAAGVTVITATQMLESMTHDPQPTRAEVSDVAYAVWEGSDAVMLSGETSVGAYPAKAVETMRKVVANAEKERLLPPPEGGDGYDVPRAVADAACRAAGDLRARAIAAFTRTGRTAKILSMFRPRVPVIAFTPLESTAARMALYRGVEPQLLTVDASTPGFAETAVRQLRTLRRAATGDFLVVVHGSNRAHCDQLRIVQV